MEKLVFSILFFLTGVSVQASDAALTVVKTWSLPSDFKINKKKIGGLSGCSLFEDKIYFVSDDRGGEGGPRVVIFNFDPIKQEIDFNKSEVIEVKTDSRDRILDLEGISVISKDKIFLSSEGDLNQKPRVNPNLFWINSKGEKTSSVEIPDAFLSEISGQQTKGAQNNLAFEGLTIDPDQKKWAAMLEAPLVQDPGSLKLVESSLESNKFDKIYSYPVPTLYSSEPTTPPGLVGYFGVSDILFLNPDSFLILERGVRLGAGITFQTQLCEATKGKDLQLGRRCFYSMNDDQQLKPLIPSGANFEGLCWVNKQKKLFITVSDNNFSKSEKTVFILYQLN